MATVDKYLSQLTFNAVAATAIAEGDLVGLDTAGTLRLADGDIAAVTASTTNRALGVAVRGGASGATIAVAPIAQVSGVTGAAALIRGGAVWLSATAGGYAGTQTTTNTEIVQFVGIALSTSSVAVNVGPAFKFQTAGTSTVAFLTT